LAVEMQLLYGRNGNYSISEITAAKLCSDNCQINLCRCFKGVFTPGKRAEPGMGILDHLSFSSIY